METKPLFWLASAKKDLQAMPADVQDVFGYALDLAQRGERHKKAKPFHLQGESGIVEVVDDFDGDTYRAVYTVRFQDAVYVLHCFQKKSTRGIKTPQQDVDVIRDRLRRLKEYLS